MDTAKNPLVALAQSGQSVWLDYIRRSILDNGELKRHVEQDLLKGVTSNPAIFEKAIAGSSDYARDLAGEGERCARDPKGVYERLAIADIQRAADVLAPVYRETKRRDGYVSLEVSPHLAHDTQGTLAEARRLWQSVARENLMIKVPGTPAGVPAIRQLIGDGINVNVTLLFAVEAYEKVADAFIAGLEQRAKAGQEIAHVASVASFFVSRIDSLIDPELERRAQAAKNETDRAQAERLRGKIAIANAKVAYQSYQKLVAGPRWKELAKRGAMSQRLLWASTSTKDARFRDVVYVEELIGPDTVNTIPPATFDAFKDHGVVRATLAEGVDEARATMAALARLDLSMEKFTSELLDQGVKLFADAFDKLLSAVASHGARPG